MPLDPIIQGQFPILGNITPGEVSANPALAAAIPAFYRLNLPYEPPPVATHEVSISGPKGSFRLRIYQPSPTPANAARPALVWVHGGGFTAGSIDMPEADLVSREVCARAGVVVVSVDYHLANGKDLTYPLLHQEVTEGWLWTKAHSAELGLDSKKIALGGGSAGANLAIAATLELRSRGETLPARLVLVYPFTQRILGLTPEFNEHMQSLPPLLRLSQNSSEGVLSMYLGAQREAPFATFEKTDFNGFPPVLVILSEYDDLLPSGEAFARRARRGGVEVESYLAKGVVHGHLNFKPVVPEVDASIQKIVDFLQA